MKLPNGYGSVRKLSGKRRKPWHVQKTVGFSIDTETQKVSQNRETIGYYATRQEALQALADYNANPYDLNAVKITFAEVWEKWSAQKFESVSVSNVQGYKAAYNVCSYLYDMPFVDIKLAHLQKVVDESGKNYPTLRKLKVLFHQLFEYAIIHEIITKERDIVEYVNIKDAGNPNSFNRSPFTAPEIVKLWENVHTNDYLQIPLMLIYSGLRISELLDLKKSDVHLNEKWFYIRDSKTQAGIRAVPIADKTYSFFEHWYNKNNCEYLISNPREKHFLYRNFYDSYWVNILEPLDIKRKPHDARHTCISLLAKARVDQTTIKKIVGHRGTQSLTERVYTHLDISVLLEAINLI